MYWRKERGQRAEHRARRWLEQRGLVPVIANYQCRLGEVDLIMDDGETLVFVEVRWRAYNRYGGALASKSCSALALYSTPGASWSPLWPSSS